MHLMLNVSTKGHLTFGNKRPFTLSHAHMEASTTVTYIVIYINLAKTKILKVKHILKIIFLTINNETSALKNLFSK